MTDSISQEELEDAERALSEQAAPNRNTRPAPASTDGLAGELVENLTDYDNLEDDTAEARLAAWTYDNRNAILAALRRPTAPEPSEGVVRQIAQFVREWNGDTYDGDTFLIADEIEEQFALAEPSALVGLLREREKIGIERAIDIALTARLPKERWSCSDDASGTALTLSRQRMFIRDELKAEITRIDTALTSEGGSDA